MSIDREAGHLRNSWRAAKKIWCARRCEARQPYNLPRDRILFDNFACGALEQFSFVLVRYESQFWQPRYNEGKVGL